VAAATITTDHQSLPDTTTLITVVARHQPGTVDTNREGVGGGFRELDEEEAAEARRRREQFENDDTGMCAHPVCRFLLCSQAVS
jgi:hypothetical protein